MTITENDVIVRNYMIIDEDEIDCELDFNPNFNIKGFFKIPNDEWEVNKIYESYGNVLYNQKCKTIKVEFAFDDSTVYWREFGDDTAEYNILLELIDECVSRECDFFNSANEALDDYESYLKAKNGV